MPTTATIRCFVLDLFIGTATMDIKVLTDLLAVLGMHILNCSPGSVCCVSSSCN